jgi:hypothetical protein
MTAPVADVVRRAWAAVAPSTGRPAVSDRSASGWLVVTMWREPSELDAHDLPQPLLELGDRVEVRVRPAPGDKGSELAARLRDHARSDSGHGSVVGADPQTELRSALRRAKQLLEVGEVLAVDPTPHGDRTPTPGGVLLEAWTKVAPGAGVR